MKTLRTCKNGHTYFKTSDCPTCPTCEKQQKPIDGLLALLYAPARRALANKGIQSVEELATYSKAEILSLHGMGPSTIPILEKALSEKGLHFK
jgi:predicted RecB family nuclease